MYKQWTGKDVNLELLSERILYFFKNRGIKCKGKCSYGKTDDVKKVFRFEIKCECIFVRVYGRSDDFLVEFDANFNPFLYNLTLFGGGLLFLRKVRSMEGLERIESEFWAFVEDAVADLEGLGKSVKDWGEVNA